MPEEGSPVWKAQLEKTIAADEVRLREGTRGRVQTHTLSLEAQKALAEGKVPPKPGPLVLTTEQVRLGVEEFFRKSAALQRSKNEDYASADDGLWNFRTSSQRLGLTMMQTFMTLVQKHLIALENDCRRPHVALNEGVEDRLRDLAIYSALLYTALKEEDLNRRSGA